MLRDIHFLVVGNILLTIGLIGLLRKQLISGISFIGTGRHVLRETTREDV